MTETPTPLSIADPERALAVAYAPARMRSALEALFALDERLGAIVAATHQPTIGLMRLAWWREALERLGQQRVPAEPLLQALATHTQRHVSGAALADIEDGWAALIDGEPDADAIARHGRERGGNLFALAARILGTDEDRARLAGTGWALADLAHRHTEPAVRAEARRQAHNALARLPEGGWSGAGRALGGLAVLARRDVTAETRTQASPARVARMLAMRLTGR